MSREPKLLLWKNEVFVRAVKKLVHEQNRNTHTDTDTDRQTDTTEHIVIATLACEHSKILTLLNKLIG